MSGFPKYCSVSRWLMLLGIVVGTTGSAMAQGPAIKAMTAELKKQQSEAEAAERAGKWEQALEIYLKLYTSGSQISDIRERIRNCVRHSSQLQRQRDPVFQQYILSLPANESLTLYVDAVTKIQALYTEREKATIDKLFMNGLDEIDRALNDANFIKQHCPEATELKIHKFRQIVREVWKSKLPLNAREARMAAREITVLATNLLGVRSPSAINLELLCGACYGLDEYSAYFTPNQDTSLSPILELGAYGLLVSIHPDGLLVDGVIPNSWSAMHTAVQKGDIITTLNTKTLRNVTLPVLSEMMKNADPVIGYDLEVTGIVPTTGPEPELLRFRLPTPIPSVYGAEMLREGIGYIRLSGFHERTPRELDDSIDRLKMHDLRALIIDLRGNAGGSLPASVAAAQRFMPDGVIATTTSQVPEFANRVFQSESGINALDIPIVLLVDTKTMSAAEVFSTALKENGRATLVGMPTFGKGLVQAPIRLNTEGKPDGKGKGGFLLLSVASLSGPRGKELNGQGVSPHVTEPDPKKQMTEAVNKALEHLNGIPVGMR